MVDKARLLEAIERIVLSAQNNAAGTVGSYIVLVGGSALCIRGLRDQSYDVDFYGAREFLLAAASLEKELLSEYGDEFRIDGTMSDTIWGRIKIGDIADSPVVGKYLYGNQDFEIRALTPETLFIQKADSGREKDLADLVLIAPSTTPERIANRLGKFIQYSDPNETADLIANVFGEIQVVYNRVIDRIIINELPEPERTVAGDLYGVQ